jgi:hypothetical protein
MKIKRSTYEKLLIRRKWMKNTLDDMDKIIEEIEKENK